MSETATKNDVITIDMFNRITKQETLHPLVTVADLSRDSLSEDLRLPCDFYALVCKKDCAGKNDVIKLVNPGDTFEVPAANHCATRAYTGILFHPDLLCDTPLEHHIGNYPMRCSCRSVLTGRDKDIIAECIHEIDRELHHAIDRHSALIIVSHIELLLNYCTRFCDKRESTNY